MLVLLSFALVLAATVLLVLGLLNDDGLMLIYISIGASVAAATVLMIALRRNKPRVDAGVPPKSLSTTEEAAASTQDSVAAGDSEWLAADWEEGEEVDFPIADYDDLTAGQILPLLSQLYADEIAVVGAREANTKARPEILDKLAELRGDAPASDSAALADAAPPAPGSWEDDDWFPIEDYESLSAAQIRPLLGELDAEELDLVRTRELGLGRRRSLLDEIDRRLGTVTRSAPARKASVTKKAAATKRGAATKRTSAPARRAAAPAKRAAAPAKRVPVKRAAAPAKRVPVKRAAAPVKRVPVKRAAAPVKKASSAKRAAAPVKKASSAKKAAKRGR